MKNSNYETQVFVHESGNEHHKNIVFKKIAVSPQHNSFLSTKICLQNVCFMSIQSGQFEWKLNGQDYKLMPQDILLACPGVILEKNINPLIIGEFYKISLDPSYYSCHETGLNNQTTCAQSELTFIWQEFKNKQFIIVKQCKESLNLFQKMEEEYRNCDQIGFNCIRSAMIDELMVSIYRSYLKNNNNDIEQNFTFDLLTENLENNLSHNWSVKEMADLGNMNVTQLTAKMKSEIGFSPFDYLIYLRIQKAMKLLKGSNQSITSIALDTGFYSSQHFSNSFRKIMGITPRDFRGQSEVV